MKAFAGILSEGQLVALASYVVSAFAECSEPWPSYHTAANGWADHRRRYETAYPYVLGERALEPADSGVVDAGLRLFRETCAVCHDPAARGPSGRLLRVAAGAAPAAPGDPETSAHHDHDEEYASEHDDPPRIPDLTPEEARGEALYQANCAICHAADGTGRNWIGAFLEPHPPDFTDATVYSGKDDEALSRAILDGLPGSSMPAFRSALSPADARDITAYLRRAFAPR